MSLLELKKAILFQETLEELQKTHPEARPSLSDQPYYGGRKPEQSLRICNLDSVPPGWSAYLEGDAWPYDIVPWFKGPGNWWYIKDSHVKLVPNGHKMERIDRVTTRPEEGDGIPEGAGSRRET